MLFARRTPPGLAERLRVALWPRRNFTRSFKYLAHRIWRLRSSAHATALGMALGVFAVFTPFLGLQMALAALLALLLRASVTAALLGTFAGNPVTYPFIWLATHRLGSLVAPAETRFRAADVPRRIGELWRAALDASAQDAGQAAQALWQMLRPLAIGAVPLGCAAAAITYIFVKRLLARRPPRKRRALRLKPA